MHYLCDSLEGMLGLEEDIGRLFVKIASDRAPYIRKESCSVLISWLA